MYYSETIKRMRKERGLTQQELADALGVSRSAIGMYESGTREPNFEMCEALADFFNCRLSDIIEEAPANTGASPRVEELVRLLDSLPDEALDKAYDYISMLHELNK